MSEHRDPVVADALRDLDIPEHGPDFWAALESRLADEASVEAGVEGGPAGPEARVVDLSSSPAARRLAVRRRPPLGLVAAAAVVVALVVGAALLQAGGEDPQQVDTADPIETPAPEDGSADTTIPTPDPSVPSSPRAGMAPEQAEAAAVEWLDRLFAGDVVSRSVLQVETAAGVVSVVTFSGDVEREGMVETASYPVVLTDTGVHFTLDGPQLELDSEYLDSSGTTLASPLVLTIGEDVPEVWVWYDGDAMEPVEGRGRVELDVDSQAGPGTHLVTLLAVRGDRIVARAHTVVVP